jgi:hypothetical protein
MCSTFRFSKISPSFENVLYYYCPAICCISVVITESHKSEQRRARRKLSKQKLALINEVAGEHVASKFWAGIYVNCSLHTQNCLRDIDNNIERALDPYISADVNH